MTKYVRCRLCKNFVPLTREDGQPRFSIKENGIEEAVCENCFKDLVNFFRQKNSEK